MPYIDNKWAAFSVLKRIHQALTAANVGTVGNIVSDRFSVNVPGKGPFVIAVPVPDSADIRVEFATMVPSNKLPVSFPEDVDVVTEFRKYVV